MATAVNPLTFGSVPGGPPTAATLSSPASGANPFMPSSGFSATGTPGTTGVVPGGTATTSSLAFPANIGPFSTSTTLAGPGGRGPFSFLGGMSPTDVTRLYRDIQKTYGTGLGHLITQFLLSGAGFDQQTISNLLASLQPGIERGEEDIMEQFSAMGTRFGSPAATGLADFLSRVNLNEGEIIAQMYESALDRFVNVLTGTGGTVAQARASSPSGLDALLGGFGIGSKIGGGRGGGSDGGAQLAQLLLALAAGGL